MAEQFPGPFATMILADLGADVILVERPQGGDPTRRFPGHFGALNRNKRSVSINLKHDKGRSFFWKLAATSDVVVEGFRPGVVDRLGIGPQDANERLPSLIYASISGFGQSGELRDRPTHDLTVQGMAGLISGGDLAIPALPLGDLAAAMYAAVGIVTALLARERHGDAPYIDIAMLDSLYAWRTADLGFLLNGVGPRPYPPQDPGYGTFETQDGISFSTSIAGEDHHWRALCEAVGLPDLAALTTAEREAGRLEIGDRLRSAASERDWGTLKHALEKREVPFGPVYDDTEFCNDPQLLTGGLLETVSGDSTVSERGVFRTLRQPIIFDGQRGGGHSPAPRLGQHNHDLALELGYGEAAIAELVSTGVLGFATPHEPE